MKGCGGVWDVPTLEHALRKAKDELASAQNERTRRALERQITNLGHLLDLARAAVRAMEKSDA